MAPCLWLTFSATSLRSRSHTRRPLHPPPPIHTHTNHPNNKTLKPNKKAVLNQRKSLMRYLYRKDRAAYDRLCAELKIRSVVAGDAEKKRLAAAAAAAKAAAAN